MPIDFRCMHSVSVERIFEAVMQVANQCQWVKTLFCLDKAPVLPYNAGNAHWSGSSVLPNGQVLRVVLWAARGWMKRTPSIEKGRAVPGASAKRSPSLFRRQQAQMAPAGAVRRDYRALLGIALLLLASIGVRVWYDQRALPPLSANPHDIEVRAREEPGSSAAQIDWGELLRQQGRWDEANRAFASASRLDPQDARPYIGLALVAMAQHQPAQAADYYRHATQIDPSDTSAWSGLAAQYELLHQKADALAAYTKLIQLNPNDANAARQLGLLYTEQGQVFRAHDFLARAAQLDPTDLRTQRYLGENTFMQERFAESRQALDKVLAQEPDNFAVLSMLAQILIRLDPSPQGLALAERYANRSLAIKQTGSAHMALGQIYLARRQYAPAIAEFKTAIAIYPDLLLAYVSLSQAYRRTDRPDLALKTDADYQATLARQKRASGNVGYKPLPWR